MTVSYRADTIAPTETAATYAATTDPVRNLSGARVGYWDAARRTWVDSTGAPIGFGR